MGDEYQLRRDIDKIFDKTYDYDENIWNIYTKDEINKKLTDNYYDKGEIDGIVFGDVQLDTYYTKTEINTLLSSYATIGYANSRYALINHTHSQYITREEISDLDINLTTLQLVPKSDNVNGVMCFERVQKTIDELDIDLSVDTMSNGYLKIEANLIERSDE